MGKLASFCWDGLTLKNVSHPKVVKPYLFFMFISLLFELFMLMLFGVSGFLFYRYGMGPDLLFFVSGIILTILLIITVFIIKAITCKAYS